MISRRFSPGAAVYNGAEGGVRMKKRRTFTLPPGAKKAGAWLKWPLLGFCCAPGRWPDYMRPLLWRRCPLRASGCRGLPPSRVWQAERWCFWTFNRGCAVRRRLYLFLPPTPHYTTCPPTKSHIFGPYARQVFSCWCRASICWVAVGRAGCWPCAPRQRQRARHGCPRQSRRSGVICAVLLWRRYR